LRETCLPLHDSVRGRISELFAAGIRRISEFQTMLADFVTDMFAGKALPARSDARFWPSNRTVLGVVSRLSARSRYCFSKLFDVRPTVLCNATSPYA